MPLIRLIINRYMFGNLHDISEVTLVLSFLLHRCKETVSWIDSQQDSKKQASISIKIYYYSMFTVMIKPIKHKKKTQLF
jgi:hypothetical protein